MYQHITLLKTSLLYGICNKPMHHNNKSTWTLKVIQTKYLREILEHGNFISQSL